MSTARTASPPDGHPTLDAAMTLVVLGQTPEWLAAQGKSASYRDGQTLRVLADLVLPRDPAERRAARARYAALEAKWARQVEVMAHGVGYSVPPDVRRYASLAAELNPEMICQHRDACRAELISNIRGRGLPSVRKH